MSVQKILYNQATSQYELLMTPIFSLSLKIQNSIFEKLIREVKRELQKHRLAYKPHFYLSDEFGCVEGTVNIGIPFYMASPELEELNREVGSEKHQALEDHQLKALLRHECGHAFFYAYGLQRNKTAQKLFGNFESKRVSIKNIPLEPGSHVDYLERWGAASQGYSRTHPEEDFSDTFAAWLDPAERKNTYQGQALKKMKWIERTVKKVSGEKPLSLPTELHKPYTALKETVENFFRHHFGAFDLEAFRQKATGFLDSHLKEAFSMPNPLQPKRNVILASSFLEKNKRHWIRENRRSLKTPLMLCLTQKSIERAHALHLTVSKKNLSKAKKIFSAILVLMGTLIEEKGRVN